MFKKFLDKIEVLMPSEDDQSHRSSHLNHHQNSRSADVAPLSTPVDNTNTLTKKYSLDLENPWEHVEVIGDDGELLNTDSLRMLANMMPMKEQFMDWQLIYGSNKHGLTSSTLYSKCSAYGGPCLLLVKIDKDHVVGAFTSHAWTITDSGGQPHKKHYGSGTCFLFTIKPKFRIYPWSGKNEYFMKTDKLGLHLGLSDGFQGLWIDESLTKGASNQCETYDNECLAGEENKQFSVASIEVYGVVG